MYLMNVCFKIKYKIVIIIKLLYLYLLLSYLNCYYLYYKMTRARIGIRQNSEETAAR